MPLSVLDDLLTTARRSSDTAAAVEALPEDDVELLVAFLLARVDFDTYVSEAFDVVDLHADDHDDKRRRALERYLRLRLGAEAAQRRD